jgi:hypothetical protein
MAMKEKEMSETILPILLKLNGVVYNCGLSAELVTNIKYQWQSLVLMVCHW